MILVFQDPFVPGVFIHQAGQGRAETFLVGTALGGVNRVRVGMNRLGVSGGPLQGDFEADGGILVN